MPGRRHFRGPRRPPQEGGEGAAATTNAQPQLSTPFGEARPEGDDRAPARRRRRRGGRGRGAGQPAGADTPAADSVGSVSEAGEARVEGEVGVGDPARRKRRRRRGGRSREGPAAPPQDEELAEGELPADYISFPVERGTPLFYHEEERALVPIDDEQDEDEPRRGRPIKAKRINSGKLFWYLRSKSYVPIPELRRRFEVSSEEMATIQDDGKKLYVGLPQDLADVVANLRRQNKIGLETAPEFSAAVVVGIYPILRGMS